MSFCHFFEPCALVSASSTIDVKSLTFPQTISCALADHRELAKLIRYAPFIEEVEEARGKLDFVIGPFDLKGDWRRGLLASYC